MRKKFFLAAALFSVFFALRALPGHAVTVLPAGLIKEVFVTPDPPYFEESEIRVTVELSSASLTVTAAVERPDGAVDALEMGFMMGGEGTRARGIYRFPKSGNYTVRVAAENGQDREEKTVSLTVTDTSEKGGGGGGGCDAGMGLWALFSASLFLIFSTATTAGKRKG
ncbi:MAG: hypothetical protein LBO68_00395 [Synergistaceae bacterium]|nr:hypothetical protein [Synergistaceae bacterium]